jgi:hypothetical protein
MNLDRTIKNRRFNLLATVPSLQLRQRTQIRVCGMSSSDLWSSRFVSPSGHFDVVDVDRKREVG